MAWPRTRFADASVLKYSTRHCSDVGSPGCRDPLNAMFSRSGHIVHSPALRCCTVSWRVRPCSRPPTLSALAPTVLFRHKSTRSKMSNNITLTFLGTTSGGGPTETRNCSSLVVDALGTSSLWSASTVPPRLLDHSAYCGSICYRHHKANLFQ